MSKTKHPFFHTLTADEKAAYLADARRRGGLTRAAQPSFKEACSKGGTVRCQQESMALARSKGYWRLWDTNPQALLWLKKKIRNWNQAHANAHNLPVLEWRFQRFRTLRIIYKKYGS